MTDIQTANLHRVFADLDSKINQLGQVLESHRKWPVTEEKESHKCSWVCQKEKDKMRCLRQCAQSQRKVENIDDFESEFPIDVQRLRTDHDLRRTFERHQRAPETIQSNLAEALDVSDIYAMPISTAALPEISWSQAMQVMTRKENRGHLKKLVQNWSDRANDYPDHAKDELIRKIQRHDSNDTLIRAINEK